VVFDGDCGFCRFWVARWRYRTDDRVEYVPSNAPGITERLPGLQLDRLARAVHLIELDGRVSAGAEAVFRLLAYAGSRIPLTLYTHLAAVAAISDAAYELVANHRGIFSKLTRLLIGRSPEPARYALTAWLFLRLLGFVYLAAFWSLAVQARGLLGEGGILPVRMTMAGARAYVAAAHLDADRFRLLPTLFWWSTSDQFLIGSCAAGLVGAVLLIAGIAPVPILAALWIDYLSLSLVGREFLSYQWDALLLETGFLAILLAPLVVRERRSSLVEPPRLARWLLLWLMFRLNVASGAIKLASGDPMWRQWTALSVHFETQPIPTPIAWYVHQLPLSITKALTAIAIGVELLAPFLILTPRRPRRLGFVLLAGFQLLIALTGNYAFFNLLTIALCLLLLDDEVLRWFVGPSPVTAPAPSHRARRLIVIPAALVTVPVSVVMFAASLDVPLPAAALVQRVAEIIGPFRSVNTYGLFAVMTPTRPEIVIEGSDDGQQWLAYEFKYKPGNLQRRPPWVAPHQPRLDWQMWFAALEGHERSAWYRSFCVRLLQGSPDVLALLARNPFPSGPPRYVRGTLYRYRFTDTATRRSSGQWWTRESLGEYSPAISRNLEQSRPFAISRDEIDSHIHDDFDWHAIEHRRRIPPLTNRFDSGGVEHRN
jgi:predicted DCC family thiol-disulfide oxidoreductase YuxK